MTATILYRHTHFSEWNFNDSIHLLTECIFKSLITRSYKEEEDQHLESLLRSLFESLKSTFDAYFMDEKNRQKHFKHSPFSKDPATCTKITFCDFLQSMLINVQLKEKSHSRGLSDFQWKIFLIYFNDSSAFHVNYKDENYIVLWGSKLSKTFLDVLFLDLLNSSSNNTLPYRLGVMRSLNHYLGEGILELLGIHNYNIVTIFSNICNTYNESIINATLDILEQYPKNNVYQKVLSLTTSSHFTTLNSFCASMKTNQHHTATLSHQAMVYIAKRILDLCPDDDKKMHQLTSPSSSGYTSLHSANACGNQLLFIFLADYLKKILPYQHDSKYINILMQPVANQLDKFSMFSTATRYGHRNVIRYLLNVFDDAVKKKVGNRGKIIHHVLYDLSNQTATIKLFPLLRIALVNHCENDVERIITFCRDHLDIKSALQFLDDAKNKFVSAYHSWLFNQTISNAHYLKIVAILTKSIEELVYAAFLKSEISFFQNPANAVADDDEQPLIEHTIDANVIENGLVGSSLLQLINK